MTCSRRCSRETSELRRWASWLNCLVTSTSALLVPSRSRMASPSASSKRPSLGDCPTPTSLLVAAAHSGVGGGCCFTGRGGRCGAEEDVKCRACELAARLPAPFPQPSGWPGPRRPLPRGRPPTTAGTQPTLGERRPTRWPPPALAERLAEVAPQEQLRASRPPVRPVSAGDDGRAAERCMGGDSRGDGGPE